MADPHDGEVGDVEDHEVSSSDRLSTVQTADVEVDAAAKDAAVLSEVETRPLVQEYTKRKRFQLEHDNQATDKTLTFGYRNPQLNRTAVKSSAFTIGDLKKAAIQVSTTTENRTSNPAGSSARKRFRLLRQGFARPLRAKGPDEDTRPTKKTRPNADDEQAEMIVNFADHVDATSVETNLTVSQNRPALSNDCPGHFKQDDNEPLHEEFGQPAVSNHDSSPPEYTADDSDAVAINDDNHATTGTDGSAVQVNHGSRQHGSDPGPGPNFTPHQAQPCRNETAQTAQIAESLPDKHKSLSDEQSVRSCRSETGQVPGQAVEAVDEHHESTHGRGSNEDAHLGANSEAASCDREGSDEIDHAAANGPSHDDVRFEVDTRSPDLPARLIREMELWKQDWEQQAQSIIDKWVNRYQVTIQKKQRMKRHIREMQVQEIDLRDQLAKREDDLEILHQLNEQLKEDIEIVRLEDQRQASLTDCQERLTVVQTDTVKTRHDIEVFTGMLEKISRTTTQSTDEHLQVNSALHEQLDQLLHAIAAIGTQVQSGQADTGELTRSAHSLNHGCTQLKHDMTNLQESISSKLDAALASVDSGSEESRAILLQIQQHLTLLGTLGERLEADLTLQLPHLGEMMKGISELLSRPLPSEPPVPLDVESFLGRVNELILGANQTTVEKLEPILAAISSTRTIDRSLAGLVVSLQAKDAQIKEQQALVLEFQRHMTQISGDLDLATQERQLLQKQNLRLTDENVQVKLEVANNRASLADWKAEASIQTKHAEAATAELTKCTRDMLEFQAKIEMMEQVPVVEQTTERVVIDALRGAIRGEMAAALVESGHAQQLQQYRTFEMQRIQTALNILGYKYHTIRAHHIKMKNMYATLSEDHKAMTEQRDEYERQYNATQYTLHKAQSTKGEVRRELENAKQRLVEAEETRSALNQQLAEMHERYSMQATERGYDKDAHNQEIGSLMQQIMDLEDKLTEERAKNDASPAGADKVPQEVPIERQSASTPTPQDMPASAVANSGMKRKASSQQSRAPGSLVSQDSGPDESLFDLGVQTNENSSHETAASRVPPRRGSGTLGPSPRRFKKGSGSMLHPGKTGAMSSSPDKPSKNTRRRHRSGSSFAMPGSAASAPRSQFTPSVPRSGSSRRRRDPREAVISATFNQHLE